jgi:uncharacterized membrane protein
MKRDDKIWLIIFGLISVVYILLRMWNLTASCLWFDEIFSVHAATLPWQNLFWFVAQDLIHPPLFYALLKIWILAGGENLFWLRFFPVLFSILSVIPFLLLCRQFNLSSPSITLALTFFAVNGSLIKYAQEVRMYSLLLCFALFSMWLFARFLNSGKGFLLFIAVNILLVYSHYFGWLIIVSEILAVVILARERLKSISLMFGATVISFLPWIFAIWQATKINANVGQNIGWMTKPNLLSIFQFIFDLFEPVYFEQSNTDEPTIFLITLPILAIGTVAIGFYFVGWKSESKVERKNFLLLLIFLLTPISLAFIASWILPYSVWGTRHLIIAFAPFVILLATVFSKIKLQKLKIASLSIIFLLSGAAFLLQATRSEPKYIWCAWENLAHYLYDFTLHGEDADNIYLYTYEDLIAYHFWFALRDSDRGFQIIKVNGVMSEDKAYFLPRSFGSVQTVNEDEIKNERFFISFRAKDWNEFAPPLQNLISKGYRISEPQVFEAQGLKAFLVEARKETNHK